MTERAILAEAEDMFRRIDSLIHSDSSQEELVLAKNMAWRMWMRLEELRLRHPY